MPSSSVRTFTEPYEYAAAIRATTIEMVVRERGHFVAKRTRIDFDRLWMQRLSENTSRTLHSSFVTGRAIVTFRTQPGQTLHWSGVDIEPSKIIRHPEGEEAFQHSSGPTSWGAMSLPLADIVAVGGAMAGLDLTPPTNPLVLSPSAGALERLQRLHATAGDLAEYAPAVIAHPEAARGLEQALIEAMIHCFPSEAYEDRAAQRQHAAIMRRFHRVVEEHLDEPLYVPELCKEVGASERTLITCCHEHLGMGAKHYLLLRRMHMVRRALRESSRGQTTVTEAAARYGFWQFGRLAVAYRALFGEAPSATLARAA